MKFPLFEGDPGTGGTQASAAQTDTAGATGQLGTAPTLDVTQNFSDIPQEFANDPDFSGKQLKDVFTEFKQLKGLHDNREQNGLLEMIGEQSTPEQVQAFYEKLGKPKSAAEYELVPPEDLPQGLDYSDERAAAFAEFAFQNNLTKAQTQAVFRFYHDMVKQEYESTQKLVEEQAATNLAELESRWGGPVGSPKFELNHKNAMRAFNAGADKEIAEIFKRDPSLSSNPAVLRLLANLGAQMEPDSVPSVGEALPTGRFADSAAGIDKQIKAFYDSGKFKQMMDASNPNQKALREEWNALYEKRRKLESPE